MHKPHLERSYLNFPKRYKKVPDIGGVAKWAITKTSLTEMIRNTVEAEREKWRELNRMKIEMRSHNQGK
jgi:hypothetical protein